MQRIHEGGHDGLANITNKIKKEKKREPLLVLKPNYIFHKYKWLELQFEADQFKWTK